MDKPIRILTKKLRDISNLLDKYYGTVSGINAISVIQYVPDSMPIIDRVYIEKKRYESLLEYEKAFKDIYNTIYETRYS